MFNQKTILQIALVATLNLANNLPKAYASFMQTFDEDSVKTYEELEQIRPTIDFPDNFEISISTNEFGLNITEQIYYDKLGRKMRMQLYYSILGLDRSKGFDLVLDEANETVAVQHDEDCKKTSFTDTLLPINLFFKMFNQLTDYEGVNDGLHQFRVKSFNENTQNIIKFQFYFDEELNFVKASFYHEDLGKVYFDVVEQLRVRTFKEEEWYPQSCDQIQQEVLQSGNGWVSFTHELIKHLFLNGQDIQTYLGWRSETVEESDEEPEDFEE